MNKLLIFTAPSGAGKTTIIKYLLKKYPQLAFSVSATTREQRKDEVHGNDYYFLSVDEFKQKIEDGELLEWEEVYNNRFYGTLRGEVERLWKLGKCVVFDIDVKGAKTIKDIYPNESLAIFVKPPSFQELVRRLELRRTEDTESFGMRIQKAKEELLFEHDFDYVLVNDDLRETFGAAEAIIEQFLTRRR